MPDQNGEPMARINPDPYTRGHLFALVHHVTSLIDSEEYSNVSIGMWWALNVGIGMWWALQTVTTVGYGDSRKRAAVHRRSPYSGTS